MLIPGRYQTDAPAKVNLLLKVLGRFDNGYHNIVSVIAPVSLADSVEIVVSNSPGLVTCSVTPGAGRSLAELGVAGLKSDENIASHAVEKYFAAHGQAITQGIEINIIKRIPAGAGMGGGSADAAAVLRILDVASGRSSANNTLSEIAALIGADVPAMLAPDPVLVAGDGTEVFRLEARDLGWLREVGLMVAKPSSPVLTSKAYQALGFEPGQGRLGPFEFSSEWYSLLESLGFLLLDEQISLTLKDQPDSSQLLKAGSRFDWFVSALNNDFESVLEVVGADSLKVKAALLEHGAKDVCLTGSGSAFIAYFESLGRANRFETSFRASAPASWFVETAQLLPDRHCWAVAKR